ncbi:MAG: STAS domain-containing protein [Verrucomicrobia bacterium]|nr:STAS domain-containing protein [Verrucomicrobiota bacterium]
MKSTPRLTVEERREGRDRILKLQGTADILCLPELQDLFARLRREDVRLLAIDLSATEFINSPVWAVITLYARKPNGAATPVAIIGMPDRIRGSFEMMGLQRELRTYPTLEAARRDLGVPAEG